jgi:hypothetical protein
MIPLGQIYEKRLLTLIWVTKKFTEREMGTQTRLSVAPMETTEVGLSRIYFTEDSSSDTKR